MIPLARLQMRGEDLVARSRGKINVGSWMHDDHHELEVFISDVLGELTSAHEDLDMRNPGPSVPAPPSVDYEFKRSPAELPEQFLLLQLNRGSVLAIALLPSPEEATVIGALLAERAFGVPCSTYGALIDPADANRRAWTANGTALLRLSFLEHDTEWAVCGLTPTTARMLAPILEAAFATADLRTRTLPKKDTAT